MSRQKCVITAGAYPEIWIRAGGMKGWGLGPSPPLGSSPLLVSSSLPSPSPPLRLEVGPLNPASGSGGAL